MEKIFKAKRIDNGEWVEFTLGDIGGGDVKGNLYVFHVDAHFDCQKALDKNTICQYTGVKDSEGNRIFEGDYFDSVMVGDYEPMIRGAYVFFCPDELQWQGKLDDKHHCGQLNDYGIKLTGHNIQDKD